MKTEKSAFKHDCYEEWLSNSHLKCKRYLYLYILVIAKFSFFFTAVGEYEIAGEIKIGFRRENKTEEHNLYVQVFQCRKIRHKGKPMDHPG